MSSSGRLSFFLRHVTSRDIRADAEDVDSGPQAERRWPTRRAAALYSQLRDGSRRVATRNWRDRNPRPPAHPEPVTRFVVLRDRARRRLEAQGRIG